MKKVYISPSIHISKHRIKPCMTALSGTNGQPIGEGDSVTNTEQLGDGTIENETGEGMTAKGFYLGFDNEW